MISTTTIMKYKIEIQYTIGVSRKTYTHTIGSREGNQLASIVLYIHRNIVGYKIMRTAQIKSITINAITDTVN